ncbi:MAG: hypothetical protein BWY86_01024 [Candidatus Aminicenantes bacterium ADurb.Bin508]|nr:MAG: hypothetical protein BWY86_01024 [Candidatus Aminicenantes bacterium ADurb.Bin508]
MAEGFDEVHLLEGWGEGDLVVVIDNLLRGHALCLEVEEELLGELDQVVEIAVSLIKLDHRKLGVVLEVDPFVAEATVDFVDSVETSDDEPFQVEFRSDSQVELHVQSVVVGDEGTGVGPPGDGVEHGGLDFEVASLVKKFSDSPDDLEPLLEDHSSLRVHDQVEVALSVPGLFVLETVELFGHREKALGEESKVLNENRKLSGLGSEEGPFDADDVSCIEALEGRVLLWTDGVFLDVDLESLLPVGEVKEGGAAHDPLGDDSTGGLDAGFLLFKGLGVGLFVLFENLRDCQRVVVTVGVGGDTLLLEFVSLLLPDDELVMFCHWILQIRHERCKTSQLYHFTLPLTTPTTRIRPGGLNFPGGLHLSPLCRREKALLWGASVLNPLLTVGWFRCRG